MNSRTFRVSTGSMLSLAAGLLLSGGSVLAQTGNNTIEEITVVAPRQVTREPVGHTPSGGTIENISLTRRVDYSDLNLAVHADVEKLDKRVDDTAREACRQLEQLYPSAALSSPDCVRTAVNGAMMQVDKAVETAERSK